METLRCIHQVNYSTAVLIMASYSAIFTSFLAVKIISVPFTNVQGFVDDGTYKMGVLADSADYVILKVQSLHRLLPHLFLFKFK